jgi:hypothetical protein
LVLLSELEKAGLCSIQKKKNAKYIAYLMNKTESPALSLFEPTNKLHPVVRRCRFGCPA